MCVCAAVPASRGAVPQRLASMAESQVLRNQPRPCTSFLGGETERVEGLTGVKPLIFLVARAELHRRPKKFQPFQFSTDADACFVLKSGRSKRRYDCHIRVDCSRSPAWYQRLLSRSVRIRLKADIPTFSFQRLEGGPLMLTFDNNGNVDPSLLIPIPSVPPLRTSGAMADSFDFFAWRYAIYAFQHRPVPRLL